MPQFSEKSKVYPFTTENLSGYMSKINLKNQDVLSVISSGDHILNSFYYGARNVVGFDINYFASFFAELKIVAAKKLDFKNFKNFFLVGSKKPMDFETYSHLRSNLSNDCLYFFDNVYRKNGFSGRNIRFGKLFNKRFDIDKLRIRVNPYLYSEHNFKILKKNIKHKKIVFINSNVINLTSKLENKFDVIFLSNLLDYSNQIFQDRNHFNMFGENILLPLNNNLNNKGVICAAYIYSINKNSNSILRNKQLRKNLLGVQGMEYREFKFSSVIPGRENESDLIVLLKNEKKHN